jgi:uncharacterized membrane protein
VRVSRRRPIPARAEWADRCEGHGSLIRNTRRGRLDLVFCESESAETSEGVGRAESRWPPAVTVLVFVVLNVVVRLWLPTEHVLALPWLFPAVELILLGVLLASDPLGVDRRSRWFRRASIVLVLLLVAAALWTTVILIDHLINGAAQTNSAGFLLASEAQVLVGNNLAFALLYWQFDSGGPLARLERTTRYPHFAFPQQLNPDLAPPGWRPIFVDYLYLGFTNSTAFSPTDVMPLVPWAKSAMTVQATISFVVIGLVVARAVNVLT